MALRFELLSRARARAAHARSPVATSAPGSAAERSDPGPPSRRRLDPQQAGGQPGRAGRLSLPRAVPLDSALTTGSWASRPRDTGLLAARAAARPAVASISFDRQPGAAQPGRLRRDDPQRRRDRGRPVRGPVRAGGAQTRSRSDGLAAHSQHAGAVPRTGMHADRHADHHRRSRARASTTPTAPTTPRPWCARPPRPEPSGERVAPARLSRTMKTEIHPEYLDAHVRCTCGNEFTTRSTKPEIHVEICSACHPFYTGRQKLVDTGGRVERFQRRVAKGRRAAAHRRRHRRVAKVQPWRRGSGTEACPRLPSLTVISDAPRPEGQLTATRDAPGRRPGGARGRDDARRPHLGGRGAQACCGEGQLGRDRRADRSRSVSLGQKAPRLPRGR